MNFVPFIVKSNVSVVRVTTVAFYFEIFDALARYRLNKAVRELDVCQQGNTEVCGPPAD